MPFSLAYYLMVETPLLSIRLIQLADFKVLSLHPGSDLSYWAHQIAKLA